MIVLYPHNNEHVAQLARAYAEADVLDMFWTGAIWGLLPQWTRLLPISIRGELERREHEWLPRGSLRLHPRLELLRVLSTRYQSRLPFLSSYSSFFRVADSIDLRLATHMAELGDGVADIAPLHAYEGYALSSLRAYRDLGLPSILELPYTYGPVAEAIWREEALRNPAWSSTMQHQFLSQARKERKEEELDLATVVVAPSQQVASSLAGRVPEARLRVNFYGCPEPALNVASRRKGAGTLRLLYVGRLQADKGLAYLDEALRLTAPGVTLTVVGQRPPVASEALDGLLSRTTYLGTVPRRDVLTLMAEHDAFVLPSLVEGRSLAVMEALSVGTPVIITPGTGCADLVQGGGGFLVPPASTAALADVFERLRALDSDTYGDLRCAARNTAEQHSWSAYRRRAREIALLVAP